MAAKTTNNVHALVFGGGGSAERGVGRSHTNLDMRSYLTFFSTTNDSMQCALVLVATSGNVALTNVWNLGMLEFVLTRLQSSGL